MDNDVKIKQSMKRDPESHAEMAQRFIGKLQEKSKKSGMTSTERSKLEDKMKWVYEKKRKFMSGEGLSEYQFK